MTTLWIAVGALTLASLVIVLLPLWRQRRASAPARGEFDLSVYRDQLREVERDVERGLLDVEQAKAARIEVERRMLAAADEVAPSAPARSSWHTTSLPAIVIAVVVSAGALGLYFHLGAPGTPDWPLSARGDQRQMAGHVSGDTASVPSSPEEAVNRLLKRLEANPDDLEGWILLGRTYVVTGRYPQAVEAFGQAVALSGGELGIRSMHAEALVAAAGGQVTPEARKIFVLVLKDDPLNARARYYLALSQAQSGQLRSAIQGWVDLTAISAPDSSWRSIVRQQIARAAKELDIDPATISPSPEVARLTGKSAAPTISQADREALASLSPEQRSQMIRSMVERLAARLEENPDDPEGWRRLARAYEVMGETDKAKDARARAAAVEGR